MWRKVWDLSLIHIFPKIVACGGSWMVPGDAVAQKDWKRIEDITRSAVNKMILPMSYPSSFSDRSMFIE